MLKRIFGATLMLTILLVAVDEKIAELEKKAAAAGDKDRLPLLIELGIQYSQTDTAKSLEYGQQALALAIKLSDAARQAKAHQLIGNGFMNLEKSASGLEHFQAAADIYRRLGDRFEVARSNLYIGNILTDLGRMAEAAEILKQALTFYQEIKNQRGIATAAQNLGTIYGELGDYPQALQYELTALQVAEATGNKLFQANALNSIGNIHDLLGNHPQSLEYTIRAHRLFSEVGDRFGVASSLGNMGKSCWEMGRRADALRYYQESLAAARDIKNSYLSGVAINNLAVIYMQDKQYEKSIAMFTQAAKMDRETGRSDALAVCLVNIGECHYLMRRPAQAEANYRQALALAEQLNSNDLRQTVNQKLSVLYESKGDYRRALESFRLAAKAHDQMLDQAKNEKLIEMEKKYQAENRQKEIEILKRDNELLKKNGEIQKLRLSRARLRVLLLVSGIALLLILFSLIFRRYLHLLAFWKKKNYVSHYKLERQIGSGGMGVVYAATDLVGLGRTVAVKVIREELAGDPAQRKRFLNEAYLVDQLDHPNIIKVFERGEHQQTLYIAMELLSGRSLADAIRAGERLSLDECRLVMGQLADALAQIHRQGILHRDIKPENVMLVDDNGRRRVKLLDFGLARDQSLTRLTETGEILGTIAYLPPEQITQRLFSAAGDVYALGVVFYELLTMEKPFLGENPGEIIRAVLDAEPLDPRRFRPDLPVEWSGLLRRMLAKVPEQRPDDEELLAAFKT